jgi:hypothetical protein
MGWYVTLNEAGIPESLNYIQSRNHLKALSSERQGGGRLQGLHKNTHIREQHAVIGALEKSWLCLHGFRYGSHFRTFYITKATRVHLLRIGVRQNTETSIAFQGISNKTL